MRSAERADHLGLALMLTFVLAGSVLWLALPARAVTTISISPASGPPGTVVSVTGSGFGANEVVTLCWHNVRCANSGQPVTNASGGFSSSFSVPENSAEGANTVGACGRTTGDCAQTSFSVVLSSTTPTSTTTTTVAATSTTALTATTTTQATATTTTQATATTTTQANPTTTTTSDTATTTLSTTTTIAGVTTSTRPGMSDPENTPVPTDPNTGGTSGSPTIPDTSDGSGATASAPLQQFAVGPEVLADTLERSDRSSDPGKPPTTSAPETLMHEESGTVMAATGSNGPAGLSQMQGILLWFATMIAFMVGVLVYDIRRH